MAITLSNSNKPQTYYVSYNNGITTKSSIIPVFIWIFIFLSMLLTIIYVFLLIFHRKRKIIKASQWKLSMLMGIGCVICYISLILFGIDESFPINNKLNYKWNILCNFRFLLLNSSFSLIFGPLFTKIYRINKIFSTAMVKLKRYVLSDGKLFFYNTIFVTIDSILCFILIIILPFNREYIKGEMINYSITKWGSCNVTHHYGFIYFIILGVPKVVFALYCIILSISVYSTVSMMKFNEGLQVLICMVISVLLIFIAVIILSIISINSSTSSIFYYSFLCFISLMVCNFCCAVMMLPRLFAIWKGHDNEQYVKNNEVNVIKKYLKTLRSTINKQSESDKSDKNIKYSINVTVKDNDYNRLSSPSPRSELMNQTDLVTPQLTMQDTNSVNNDEKNEEQINKKIETNGHIKSITVIEHEINENNNQDEKEDESGEHSDLLMAPGAAEMIVYNNNPRLSTRL